MPVTETLSAQDYPSSDDSAKASTVAQYPLQDAELLTLSEEELIRACKKAPKVNDFGFRVRRISENAVVKFGKFVCLSETRNMEFVAGNTAIRVPRVIRAFVVPYDETFNTTYIFMEYVRGDLLNNVWDDMSKPKRERVCDQVALAIEQLQSLRIEQVGPIGGGKTRGFWFAFFQSVQFQSVRELEDWHTHKLELCKRYGKAPPDTPPFTGTFRNLTMCHMDISPRNIVLLDDEKICLLDWDFSGIYPAHFERAALRRMPQCWDFVDAILERMEPFEEEINHFAKIAYALVRVLGRDWPPK